MVPKRIDKFSVLDQEIQGNEESTALAKLLRKIIKDLRARRSLEFMIKRYAESGGSVGRKRKTKSSMVEAILSESVTWKTFLEVIFEVLNKKVIIVTIDLGDREDVITSSHSMKFTRPKRKSDDDEKEGKENG